MSAGLADAQGPMTMMPARVRQLLAEASGCEETRALCRSWLVQHEALQTLAPNRWAEPCRLCVYLLEGGSQRPECDMGVWPVDAACSSFESGE